jgi:hypothetical protein
MYPPCIYRQKSYVNGDQFCMIDSVKPITVTVCETCEKRYTKGDPATVTHYAAFWACKGSKR